MTAEPANLELVSDTLSTARAAIARILGIYRRWTARRPGSLVTL